MHRRVFLVFAILAVAALTAAPVLAQAGLTIPPPGQNQKASVSQWIGPVEVDITYNSPDVTAPNGTDRTGHIWGELVPYGMVNLGFGTCGDQCPWRAGSNENTTFRVSHDVLVQGEPLAAGTYGLHMIPAEGNWTLIFSNNSTSWGSFFYDASEDALRVEVTPKEHPYTHWLTYEFTDRQGDRATAALQWENLEVPWTIEVPDVAGIYMETMAHELRNAPGFTWTNWVNAANTAIALGHADQAVAWAEQAVSNPAVGQENFTTLSALAAAQGAAGQADAAKATLDRAIAHRTADPIQIHGLARQLLAQGQKEVAIEVFEKNAALHPGEWPVEVGMMRARSAQGRFDEAVAHAKAALDQAPDEVNRTNLQSLIPRLEAGEDVN